MFRRPLGLLIDFKQTLFARIAQALGIAAAALAHALLQGGIAVGAAVYTKGAIEHCAHRVGGVQNRADGLPFAVARADPAPVYRVGIAENFIGGAFGFVERQRSV